LLYSNKGQINTTYSYQFANFDRFEKRFFAGGSTSEKSTIQANMQLSFQLRGRASNHVIFSTN
jgi:hypothetical protein